MLTYNKINYKVTPSNSNIISHGTIVYKVLHRTRIRYKYLEAIQP